MSISSSLSIHELFLIIPNNVPYAINQFLILFFFNNLIIYNKVLFKASSSQLIPAIIYFLIIIIVKILRKISNNINIFSLFFYYL